MGRYKDYDRAPKRGGYDDDQKAEDRTSGVRPNYPSPGATRASGSVEAIVKWFNAEKGFGFVAVVGGSEAFMHIRQLEAAPIGNEVRGADRGGACRTARPPGPAAAAVVSIARRRGTANHPSSSARSARRSGGSQ